LPVFYKGLAQGFIGIKNEKTLPGGIKTVYPAEARHSLFPLDLKSRPLQPHVFAACPGLGGHP